MMNKLANDIAAAVMYKLAALTGDYGYMEKDAGSGGINHSLRSGKSQVLQLLREYGANNINPNIKEILNTPTTFNETNVFKNIANRYNIANNRSNAARALRLNMSNHGMDPYSGIYNELDPIKRKAFNNLDRAAESRGTREAIENITGKDMFQISGTGNFVRKGGKGDLSVQDLVNYFGIQNPEQEILNASLLSHFG